MENWLPNTFKEQPQLYIYLYMLFIILLESIHTEQIQKHETWAVEWRKSARPQDMFFF